MSKQAVLFLRLLARGTGNAYTWRPVPSGSDPKGLARAIMQAYTIPATFLVNVQDGQKVEKTRPVHVYSCVEWGYCFTDGDRYPLPSRPGWLGRIHEYVLEKDTNRRLFKVLGVVYPPTGRDTNADNRVPEVSVFNRRFEAFDPQFDYEYQGLADAGGQCADTVAFRIVQGSPEYRLRVEYRAGGFTDEADENWLYRTNVGTNGLNNRAVERLGGAAVPADSRWFFIGAIANDGQELRCKLYYADPSEPDDAEGELLKEYSMLLAGVPCRGTEEEEETETEKEIREEEERRRRIRVNGNRDIVRASAILTMHLFSGRFLAGNLERRVAQLLIPESENVAVMNAVAARLAYQKARKAAESQYDNLARSVQNEIKNAETIAANRANRAAQEELSRDSVARSMQDLNREWGAKIADREAQLAREAGERIVRYGR